LKWNDWPAASSSYAFLHYVLISSETEVFLEIDTVRFRLGLVRLGGLTATACELGIPEILTVDGLAS
jgi:hypothetical protein